MYTQGHARSVVIVSCTDNPMLTGGELAGTWWALGRDFGLVVGNLTGVKKKKRKKEHVPSLVWCDGGMSWNVWDVVLVHTDR